MSFQSCPCRTVSRFVHWSVGPSFWIPAFAGLTMMDLAACLGFSGVMPAQAGIQVPALEGASSPASWIPAFAGMTMMGLAACLAFLASCRRRPASRLLRWRVRRGDDFGMALGRRCLDAYFVRAMNSSGSRSGSRSTWSMTVYWRPKMSAT